MSPTGTPRNRIASSVAKLTGARERKAFSQVLKKEIMIRENTNPTIKRSPMIIQETKSFISKEIFVSGYCVMYEESLNCSNNQAKAIQFLNFDLYAY